MALEEAPFDTEAQLDAFHTDPRIARMRGDLMEQCQVAYLGAIASQARCLISKPADVHKIDQYITHEDVLSPIGVQLKSTGKEDVVGEDTIKITLDKATYNTLCRQGRNWLYLLVLPLPSDGQWVKPGDDCFHLFRTMYWHNLRGLPNLPPQQEYKTVHIPKSQEVTPEWLAGIFKEYVEGEG